MSLARRHRDQILAQSAAASLPSVEGGLATIGQLAATAADRAAAQYKLRLTHDLRRLKEIHSIELKVEAKRDMLPEYDPWIDGILAASADTGRGIADEVLPTIMIWRIDVGDYGRAMPLVEYVLRHAIPLPTRYERTAPALVVEEFADAAIKVQGMGNAFPVEILLDIDALTTGVDMHDEIRAKLMKAIGTELMREVEAADPAASNAGPVADRALAALRRAHALNDRVGVKTQIKRLEKLARPAAPGAPTAPADQPPLDAVIDKIASAVADRAVALHSTLTAIQTSEHPAAPAG